MRAAVPSAVMGYRERDTRPLLPAPLARPVLEEELGRLRYFRGLLQAGYRSASIPGLGAETLRSERIALRIALPELDAVTLWSARRSDGMISIPFIEYILAQIQGSLDRLCRGVGRHRVPGDLVQSRPALRQAIGEACRDGLEEAVLPRLSDLFLDPALVDRLCREGGLVDRVVTRCEEMIGLGDRRSIRVVPAPSRPAASASTVARSLPRGPVAGQSAPALSVLGH
jgi:hypothetical protein